MKYPLLTGLVFLLIISPKADARLNSGQILEQQPDFSRVLDEIYKAHGLSQRALSSWDRRINASALMPRLSVGYDHSFRDSESIAVNDNISISGGVVTVGPEDNDFDVAQVRGDVLRVRGTWNLSDVVFNRQNFNQARLKIQLMRSRSQLSRELFPIYQKQQLALRQYLKSPRSRKGKSYYIQYELLCQRLEELSGGRLGHLFWRKS